MFAQWKKILIAAVLAFILYAGCNTQMILNTETYFRNGNPDFAMTPRLCYSLANLSYFTFRYQLAIDITNRNLHSFPYDAAVDNAQYRRAVCYEKLGKYQEAIQLYEEYLLEHPKSSRYESVMTKIAKLKALHQES